MIKRFFLSVLLLLFLITPVALFSPISAKPALANKLIDWALEIGSENLGKYSMQSVLWGVNALVQNLTGYDPSEQVAYNPEADPTAFLGKMVTTLAFSPPPAHAKDFFINKVLVDNLAAPKLGLAATGADIIRGNSDWLINFWKQLRNISYSFIIVVIIGAGFLVLINYRTDPRTTLSVMDFVPKLAIGLILITFSWVISGLFVDLSTVLVRLGISVFGSYGDVGGIIATTGIGSAVAFVAALAAAGSVVGLWAAIPLGGLGVILLIVAVAFFIGAIAAVISLTKRWVAMVLLAVFSPLVFLWGMFPNQEEAMQSWFKSMLVSALTFPTAGFLLYVVTKITPDLDPFSGAVFPGPPSNYPLLGGATIMAIITPLVSVVILFIIASIPSILEEYIDVKAPRALGDVGKQVGKMAAALPFVGGAMK